MKTIIAVAVVAFVSAAVIQLFKPMRLPNAVVYCVCAWLLAKTRQCL